MAFPAVGALSYNGYTFTGERHVDVETRPEYDEAGRTVALVIVKLRVEGTITSATDTGSTLETIRHTLSQPGGILQYSGDGFGSLNVNIGGSNDMRWGPKPQMLSWKPQGSARACDIVWEVECTLSACDSPGGLLGQAGLYEFNFGVSFARDRHGDVTRTIKGHLKVCQTRIPGQRTIQRCADDYLNLIQPVPPLGFARVSFDRDVSPDKSRLDFTVVDEQIKSRNAYPAKCITISGSQNVEWMRGAAASFRVTMDMDITLEAGQAGDVAWNIFVSIVQARMNIAQRSGLTVLLDSVRAKDDFFGRSGSFQAGWRINSGKIPNVFETMIQKTGMFSPLQTDWNTWRTSLAGSMFSALGHAGLKLRAGDDQLVDACGGKFVLTLPGDAIVYPHRLTNGATLTNTKPPPEKSYIYHDSSLKPYQSQPVAIHSPLQATNPDTAGVDFTNPYSRSTETPFSFAPLGGAQLQNSIHARGAPVNTTQYKGAAIRAGYPIPRPKITNIGNQAAIEKEGVFEIKEVGDLFGVTVYSAQWNILYLTAAPPTNLVPPLSFTDVA